MQQISESHKQLLATMMDYEIMNFLDPALNRAAINYSDREYARLLVVKEYMQQRISLYKK